jgi:hypothetical protein
MADGLRFSLFHVIAKDSLWSEKGYSRSVIFYWFFRRPKGTGGSE